MSHPFEAQLAHIRETLLMMSSLTDRILTMSVKALVDRDEKLAASAISDDSQIDRLEITIDELVINYMATHAPVARDCRFMMVASKISSNLERIGDQATTIAQRARDLSAEPSLKPFTDIPIMAQLAQEMLHDSITAFIEAKADMTPEIIARDKMVDDLNRQLARELTSFMIKDPKTITRCLHLLVVAKCLERVADHAENIAEEVFYLYRAQDIRHERSLTS
jgi:phosphate transport system protein